MREKTKKQKNNKIVKLNKKKIIIISTVPVAIIIGTTIGIYFAVRTEPKPLPSNIEEISWEKAREKAIINPTTDDEEIYGIYVSEEDCPFCNIALYGTSELEDGEDWELIGAFS